MKALVKVIGPAPSEMTLEELEEAIKKEHSRVSLGLIGGARSTKKKPKAPTRPSKAKALEAKYGMSLEEMERKLDWKLALLFEYASRVRWQQKGGSNFLNWESPPIVLQIPFVP